MISISGGGDDTVQVTTPNSNEEYLTYERGPIMWRAVVTGPDGRSPLMRVTAFLVDTICWGFGVWQVDEDVPLPEWPTRILQGPDTLYSALLEIDAPDGCTVTDIWPVNQS